LVPEQKDLVRGKPTQSGRQEAYIGPMVMREVDTRFFHVTPAAIGATNHLCWIVALVGKRKIALGIGLGD
jgi:hypothetical protein